MLLPGLDSNAPYLMTTSSCGQMLTMSLLYSIDFVSFQRKTFLLENIVWSAHVCQIICVLFICQNMYKCIFMLWVPGHNFSASLLFIKSIPNTCFSIFYSLDLKSFLKIWKRLDPLIFLRVSGNLVEMIRSFGTYPQEIMGTCLPLASYLLPGMRQVFSYYTYMLCHHMPS